MLSNEQIIAQSIAEFGAMRTGRSTFEMHWQEVSELVMPSFRNTFTWGSMNTPGEKKTERQVDSTAALALSRFGAILDSLLTPRNSFWHFLQADNEYVMKDRQVRLWFEIATRVLFKQRYKPTANFSGQNLNLYHLLGAFGNGFMWADHYQGIDGTVGLRYSSRPVGEIYLGENHQGMVDRAVRAFNLNAAQAKSQFGEENLPQVIKECRSQSATFDFIHRICPRLEYDTDRQDGKNKPYASYYISLSGEPKVMSEGGYRMFPGAACRYEQAPGEVYGRSPAMMVLPAIKTLNSEKRDFLVQGHRAGTPVLLTTDDGMVDVSMRPGALNKGGMSADGKPLIGVLPAGNIAVTKEMMDEERAVINDAFLVTLFQILTESPTMTATEVIERTNEKGILLAPTVGRQQSEYLGPLIDRELDILAELRLLPPMPPLLMEAKGEYQVVYTSPLSRAMRAQEASGFSRTVELALNIVNATGDPEPLDEFNFPHALREIADIQGTPESFMASPEQKAEKQQKRADLQKAQMETQAAPAAAALMKAQAAQKQAGMKPQ